MRLVQLKADNMRRVALVEEPVLRLIRGCSSVYSLAQEAIESGRKLPALVASHLTDESLDYDAIYRGAAKWKLLPPIDHPEEPARFVVSGTGLTHLGSARDRDSMHVGHATPLVSEQELTDSMKMFHWGMEGGRPQPHAIGVAPEWFYKGNGLMVHAHGEPLEVPTYAEDGGEEAEIAVAYVIGPNGQPYRVGMTRGTNSPTMSSRRRTISTWRDRSCAPARWGRRSPSIPIFGCSGKSSDQARRTGILVAADRDRRRGDVA